MAVDLYEKPGANLAEGLAAGLRDADRLELEHAGHDPLDAIVRSIRASQWSYAAVEDREVLAIWGLVVDPLLAGYGTPWLLTANGVERHQRMFLEQSRFWVGWMLHRVPRLTVLIDSEYKQALRWAKWLGFELTGPAPHPNTQKPFMIADISRETPGGLHHGRSPYSGRDGPDGRRRHCVSLRPVQGGQDQS